MVNSVKLTKLDRRVIEALSTPKDRDKYDFFPLKGSDYFGIAKRVYGEGAFNCERIGGRHVSDVTICYSVKSSLCRTLKKLWLNGFVKRGKPKYHSQWYPAIPDDEWRTCGYYGRHLRGIYYSWVNKNDIVCTDLEWHQNITLPHQTKVWWVLTDKGKFAFNPRQ